MRYILRVIKKAFLWSYERNTWQWDVLCVLILSFIFLTPKAWFTNSERKGLVGHQKDAISTVIMNREVVENQKDNGALEERVRILTGRPDAQVVGKRPRLDSAGQTVDYEVDIR
jgi:hypothetical protein